MKKQSEFSGMTLQALAIRSAKFDEEEGMGFYPVPMGEHGGMTLAEFEVLIRSALRAHLLFICMGDGKFAQDLDDGSVAQNGPGIQVYFDSGCLSDDLR